MLVVAVASWLLFSLLDFDWLFCAFMAFFTANIVAKRLPWSKQFAEIRQKMIEISFGNLPVNTTVGFMQRSDPDCIDVTVTIRNEIMQHAVLIYTMKLSDGSVKSGSSGELLFKDGISAHDYALRSLYRHLCNYTELN